MTDPACLACRGWGTGAVGFCTACDGNGTDSLRMCLAVAGDLDDHRLRRIADELYDRCRDLSRRGHDSRAERRALGVLRDEMQRRLREVA